MPLITAFLTRTPTVRTSTFSLALKINKKDLLETYV